MRNPANKQTNTDENITSLAEVTISDDAQQCRVAYEVEVTQKQSPMSRDGAQQLDAIRPMNFHQVIDNPAAAAAVAVGDVPGNAIELNSAVRPSPTTIG